MKLSQLALMFRKPFSTEIIITRGSLFGRNSRSRGKKTANPRHATERCCCKLAQHAAPAWRMRFCEFAANTIYLTSIWQGGKMV